MICWAIARVLIEARAPLRDMLLKRVAASMTRGKPVQRTDDSSFWKIPSHVLRYIPLHTPMSPPRISMGGYLGTVRYTGPVEGTSGTWLGIEWDDHARGKHDGVHNNKRYFTCR